MQCILCGKSIPTLPGRKPREAHARCLDDAQDEVEFAVAGLAVVAALVAMLKNPKILTDLSDGFTRDIRAASQLDDATPGERL